MIEFNDVKYTDLKKVVLSVNASGLLTKNIRHVAVKGPKLYDDFITTIETLPDETKLELPEDVIDFFNLWISDPDEEESQPELNFEKDPPQDSDPIEPDLEPAEDEIPTPVTESKPKRKDLVTETIKPTPAKEASLEEKPKRKLKRLSTIVMSPKVEDGKLTIAFKSLDISKSFKLPDIGNPNKLQPVRKAAMEFATANGATKGQLCNISKTLNMAGYYAR
jgi:hypothetical protein